MALIWSNWNFSSSLSLLKYRKKKFSYSILSRRLSRSLIAWARRSRRLHWATNAGRVICSSFLFLHRCSFIRDWHFLGAIGFWPVAPEGLLNRLAALVENLVLFITSH